MLLQSLRVEPSGLVFSAIWGWTRQNLRLTQRKRLCVNSVVHTSNWKSTQTKTGSTDWSQCIQLHILPRINALKMWAYSHGIFLLRSTWLRCQRCIGSWMPKPSFSRWPWFSSDLKFSVTECLRLWLTQLPSSNYFVPSRIKGLFAKDIILEKHTGIW